MRQIFKSLVIILGAAMATQDKAYAIRPFVTDDARVVGNHLAQLESWFVGDHEQLAHNVLGAIGPTNWLEVTTGFVHGTGYHGDNNGYTITGPIFQLKALVHEAENNKLPGLAFAAGVIAPFGTGIFKPKGVSTFSYIALTESLFDGNLLLHTNLGVAGADEQTRWILTPTTGLGFQAHVINGLHAVGEIYYGDPYDPISATGKAQVGFRYIVNDNIQFDGTIGKNIEDNKEQWWTLGIRLVSSPLW